MKEIVYSYVTIPEEYLNYEWNIDGRKIPQNKEKDWKKGQSIDVALSLHIENLEKFETECFHKNSKIGFTISFATYPRDLGTSIQGLIGSVSFESGKADYEIFGRIDGNKIAGKLYLKFRVYLKNDIKSNGNTIFATQKGSVLYEDDDEFVYLEGSQALFPVKAIDFTDPQFGIATNALYYLSRNFGDMDANFSTSYTLFFNTKNKIYQQINSGILEQETPDISSQYLLKIIMYDVYKTIVTDALSKNSLLSSESLLKEFDDYSALTVEAVYSNILKDLIENILQGETVETLREALAENSWGNEIKRNKLFTAIQEYIFKGDLDV